MLWNGKIELKGILVQVLVQPVFQKICYFYSMSSENLTYLLVDRGLSEDMNAHVGSFGLIKTVTRVKNILLRVYS